jgi:ribosomal-protein-alanine N-acetyltransferase
MKFCNELTMRKAHTSDARIIAAISRLHIEHGLRWRWTAKKVRRSIEDAETMVLVASVQGDVAGFAIMQFGDEQAHLHLLAVQPRYRRQKIGTSMLAWLEKSCVTAAIRNIRLEVRAANRIACDFYAGLGYRHLARVSAYYDRQEAAIVMGKSLLAD